jgi:cobalt-precorrin 5A hydrolase
MIVAGVGFRRGTPAGEIEEVVALALERLGLGAGKLGALATLADKAGEAGMRDAARRLSLPVVACERDAMLAVADRVTAISPRAEAAVGVPSVAEAAALVAAGPSAVLLLPRVATASATCAIAGGGGP